MATESSIPLKLLVDSVVEYAIFMLDPDGHVVSWNAGAERIKGYRAEEIIGKHFSVFYPPEDVAAGKPASELQIAAAEGRLENEGWRVRRDGTRFWASLVLTAMVDETGTLRGFGKVTRDLTERRAAERALRETQERFRLLVHGVLDYAIFMLDPSGHIASWNAGAERIKGYREEEVIGKHFSVFYPPEDVAAGKPAWELEVAASEGRLEDEGWRVRRDGTRFWANVVITALYDDTGTLRGFGKVTRDMTERRAAERALIEGRRLLSHLVEAQEAERRRIAWDVHDESIQAMVGVGMRLQMLAEKLPPEQAESVQRLTDTVSEAITRLRNLIFELRLPGGDEPDSLHERLIAHLGDVLEDRDIAYTLHNQLDHEPPLETTITILRICQEALTNVYRHAQATEVAVSLTPHADGVLVRVTDNGIGLREDGHETADHNHFGLLEMRERAEAAGGWWSAQGRPGNGTTVEFWVPLPRMEAGAHS